MSRLHDAAKRLGWEPPRKVPMIEKLLSAFGLRAHAQVLDEIETLGGKKPGSMLRHGRLSIWGNAGTFNIASIAVLRRECDRALAGVEWLFAKLGPHLLGVTLACSDDGVHLSVSLPAASLWLHLPMHEGAIKRIHELAGVESDGVDIFQVYMTGPSADLAARWSFMHSAGEWKSTTPRWRHGSLYLFDAFFGEAEVSHDLHFSVTGVPIPLPEGTYTWDIELHRYLRQRPRWPWWSSTWIAMEAKAQSGEEIPTEANDTCCALSRPVKGIPEAVGRIVEDVTRTRLIRGLPVDYKVGGKYDPNRPPSP